MIGGFLLMGLWLYKWRLPRYIKRCSADADRLVSLHTVYREHIWQRVKPKVLALLTGTRPGLRPFGFAHRRNLEKIENFLTKDLAAYYARIGKALEKPASAEPRNLDQAPGT